MGKPSPLRDPLETFRIYLTQGRSFFQLVVSGVAGPARAGENWWEPVALARPSRDVLDLTYPGAHFLPERHEMRPRTCRSTLFPQTRKFVNQNRTNFPTWMARVVHTASMQDEVPQNVARGGVRLRVRRGASSGREGCVFVSWGLL